METDTRGSFGSSRIANCEPLFNTSISNFIIEVEVPTLNSLFDTIPKLPGKGPPPITIKALIRDLSFKMTSKMKWSKFSY